MIDKETVVCISLAEKPGNLGATIFNTTFQELSMNYIYKPFLVRSGDLENAILGIRALNIRGCGVSMPHKVSVMRYLDEIDPVAKEIGAVNTIVNRGGKLTGYNTDFEGVRVITREDYRVKGKTVFLVGAGGAARAVICALKENQAGEIAITNRNDEKARQLAEQFHLRFVPWGERERESAHLLINATPVGMQGEQASAFSDEVIQKAEAVLDVVVSSTDTLLIGKAKQYGKVALPGIRMSVIQAIAQFKLYTSPDVSEKIIEKGIAAFFANN